MSKRSSARRRSWTATPLVALLVLGVGLPMARASAAEYAIATGSSIFAVLTHKAGIGSGLAHDHLIGTNHVVFRPIEPIDHLALGVELGLGAVVVLRHVGTGQLATPEGHRRALRIEDGEQDPGPDE